MICPFCSADIEIGPDNCCQNCSVVLQDTLVNDGFVGPSNNGLFYSSSRNRKVPYDSPENRHFKKELEVKKVIKACAITLGLRGLDERSLLLYRIIKKSTPRIKSKGNMLIYTCMFIAARQEDKPISFKRFSAFDNKVNPCGFGRIYKKVSARLDLNLASSFSDDYNLSLCSSLYSSLFKGLQCEKDSELLDIVGDLSGIDARKVLPVADEVLRLSKIALLNIGRDEAQLVAATLVIALQSSLNIFLPKPFVKKLLGYQVNGCAALTRYYEIKEFIINTVSYCVGESEVMRSRFYRYISALKHIREDVSKVSSTNPTIMHSVKEAVAQQIFTGLAKTKLELDEDLNDQPPIFCHQEVITRERALKLGFPSKTVSNLSLRDLSINISDRAEGKLVPPDDQELSSQDLSHSEFLELYVPRNDSAS